MELKGSLTERNLQAAFESKAHSSNLYEYYAYTCMHEGYQLISNAFTDSFKVEGTHAKILYELLNGPVGNTAANLAAIVDEESRAAAETYPEYARIAREEGFLEAAFFFGEVAKVHREHVEKYAEILCNIETGSVFSKSERKDWICRVCGYVHTDFGAPDECPVCKHSMGLFYIRAENY